MEEFLNVLKQQFEFYLLTEDHIYMLTYSIVILYLVAGHPATNFGSLSRRRKWKVTGNLITTSFKNLRWIEKRPTDTQTDWDKGKLIKMKKLKFKKTNTACC